MRLQLRWPLVFAALSTLLCVSTPNAYAQEEPYPSKPIRWVIGYQAGGGLDMVARLLAQSMEKTLGQPVIVDNKPGAAGIIAADFAAKSKPDGYTLVTLDFGTYALNPHLYSKISYAPHRDFRMVGLTVTIPFALFVNADLPVSTLAEFVEYIKKQPAGSVNYASTGVGNPVHLAMEVFLREAHLEMTHVPYKGAQAPLTDLANGLIVAMFNDTNTAMPHVKTGRIKVLGVATSQRLNSYPELPTFKESGYAVEIPVWVALGVPNGTADEIVQKLYAALNKALADPTIQERLTSVGFTITPSDAKEADSFVQAQLAQWGETLKPLNIKLD